MRRSWYRTSGWSRHRSCTPGTGSEETLSENLRFAIYLAISLVPSLVIHELGHAVVADRLGDPTPRRWGRLTANPRPLMDPFGSVILPALALILVATGNGLGLLPVFAYAKPMPLDPTYLRNPSRDLLLVVAGGLGANLALGAAAGVALRAGTCGEAGLFAIAFMTVNVFMFVFQLMPIPGLDGSKLLARVLPPHARAIYVNLDQYLVLFMLVVFFVLAGPLLGIVRALADAIFSLFVGSSVHVC